MAVDNASLFEKAEESAATAERNRLARDLHDAVSQTLFSASLIAEVLPRTFQKDPDEGRRRLDELRQLTRGALAEMRMLLLELRPAALAEADLPDLLRHLAEAITGRARVPVEVELQPCTDLSPDVRINFYRIAQEALNNVAKHSGACRSTSDAFVRRRRRAQGAADRRGRRPRFRPHGRFGQSPGPQHHVGTGGGHRSDTGGPVSQGRGHSGERRVGLTGAFRVDVAGRRKGQVRRCAIWSPERRVSSAPRWYANWRRRAIEVVALVRDPAQVKAAASGDSPLLRPGVLLAQGDITDKETLRAPMTGVDGVFHIAGWYKIGARDKTPAFTTNVEGTRNVLETAGELGVGKIVYTSTLAVFSDTHGRVVDEDYHFAGKHISVYDESKWRAHYEVALPLMRKGLPVVIVQPGVVYGPGDRGPWPTRSSPTCGENCPWCRRRAPTAGAMWPTSPGRTCSPWRRGGVGESYIIGGPCAELSEVLAILERLSGVPRASVAQLPGSAADGLPGHGARSTACTRWRAPSRPRPCEWAPARPTWAATPRPCASWGSR